MFGNYIKKYFMIMKIRFIFVYFFGEKYVILYIEGNEGAERERGANGFYFENKNDEKAKTTRNKPNRYRIRYRYRNQRE